MYCPYCESELDEAECYLGDLGETHCYRCRYCGMMFYREGDIELGEQNE